MICHALSTAARAAGRNAEPLSYHSVTVENLDYVIADLARSIQSLANAYMGSGCEEMADRLLVLSSKMEDTRALWSFKNSAQFPALRQGPGQPGLSSTTADTHYGR